MYNTETAKKIADYDNGCGCGDFRGFEEALYKTKNGNYFTAGSGGPMTQYAFTSGGSTSGSSDIFLLTTEEAREWLEQYGSTSEYLSEFEVDEG